MTSQTLRKSLVEFLETEVSEFYLCPVSIMEMFYKIKHKREPEPEFPDWQNRVLDGFIIAPVSFKAAAKAGSWDWEHGDPCDRLIAAVAAVDGITLVHNDSKLEKLWGFPQLYFKNVS